MKRRKGANFGRQGQRAVIQLRLAKPSGCADPEIASAFGGQAAGLIHDRVPARRIMNEMMAEAAVLLRGASTRLEN